MKIMGENIFHIMRIMNGAQSIIGFSLKEEMRLTKINDAKTTEEQEHVLKISLIEINNATTVLQYI